MTRRTAGVHMGYTGMHRGQDRCRQDSTAMRCLLFCMLSVYASAATYNAYQYDMTTPQFTPGTFVNIRAAAFRSLSFTGAGILDGLIHSV
jgi:hypothetical protein